MKMLLIKNAQISTGIANEKRTANILIQHGKIAALRDNLPNSSNAAELDVQGQLVLPGAIDPHVHFDTPGFEDREDFEHGSRAARAGGVTTVIDMPCTSLPPVTDLKSFQNKVAIIKDQAHVNYYLWAGVSRQCVESSDWKKNMRELKDAGVVGFKTYLISGMDTFKDLSEEQLLEVMAYARELDVVIGLHAEDKALIETRTKELKSKNKNSLQDYYFSRSDPAESLGIQTGLKLAEKTGCKLHIVHVASGEGVGLIREAKARGVAVTCETCPHYLAFTHDDFETLGAYLKTAPVVKTKKDQEALWQGLIDGTIDFVATDHAPCSHSEKQRESAWQAYGGIPGVQFMLPYLFSQAYLKGHITLARLIEITSTNAAKRFGIYPAKGCLQVDSDADLVVIDPRQNYTLQKNDLLSKAPWSVFMDRVFGGKVCHVILGGKVTF